MKGSQREKKRKTKKFPHNQKKVHVNDEESHRRKKKAKNFAATKQSLKHEKKTKYNIRTQAHTDQQNNVSRPTQHEKNKIIA